MTALAGLLLYLVLAKVVDRGAVFEPECHNEKVGIRTRVGGQADESHPVWGDLLAWAYPELCPRFGGSVR